MGAFISRNWSAVTLLTVALILGSSTTAHAQVVVTAPGNPIVGVAATVGSPTSSLAVVGTTPATNNYPALESPPNAIDTVLNNKYLNFQKNNAGFIVTPSASSTLTSFRFVTGNDAPERDPLTIAIEGTNSPNATTTLNSLWTLLYSGPSGLATDPGRNASGAGVSFTNVLPFSSYRMLVLTVRDSPSAANSFQFSEMLLLRPVPEPSALLLSGLAAAGVLAGRWRRSRTSA